VCDAHRSDLPDAVNPPQDRPVVARFDRLNGTLSSKRALRPSRSWPFLAAHLEDHKLRPKLSDSFDCCSVFGLRRRNQPGFGVTAREKRFDREQQSEWSGGNGLKRDLLLVKTVIRRSCETPLLQFSFELAIGLRASD
jgi:hypothetical protein